MQQTQCEIKRENKSNTPPLDTQTTYRAFPCRGNQCRERHCFRQLGAPWRPSACEWAKDPSSRPAPAESTRGRRRKPGKRTAPTFWSVQHKQKWANSRPQVSMSSGTKRRKSLTKNTVLSNRICGWKKKTANFMFGSYFFSLVSKSFTISLSRRKKRQLFGSIQTEWHRKQKRVGESLTESASFATAIWQEISGAPPP